MVSRTGAQPGRSHTRVARGVLQLRRTCLASIWPDCSRRTTPPPRAAQKVMRQKMPSKSVCASKRRLLGDEGEDGSAAMD